MLCKLGAKNQITLPKELLEGIDGPEYFEARREGVRILLEPVLVRPYESRDLSAIRSKVAGLGIDENDIESLVAEAGMHTVLDTNILVSALLFRGRASIVYRAIIESRITPCMSPSIYTEYRRVLAYRKFALSDAQIIYILREEIAPFFKQYPEPPNEKVWIPEDPEDNKFVDLARVITGSILVSGDSHILLRRNELPCRVCTLEEFLKVIGSDPIR